MIEEDSMEAKVFLTFMKPRTQKEAVEIIYQKDYQDVNITPFKNARENLVKEGLIESDGSLRGAEFRSKTEPLTKKILSVNNPDYTEDQIEGLNKLLDSFWFREFFNKKIIDTLPNITRNKKDILVFEYNSKASIDTIGQLIDNLGAFLSNRYSKEITRLEETRLEEIANYETFEDWLEDQEKKYKSSEEELIEKMLDEINTYQKDDRDKYLEVFIRRIVKDNLFLNVPADLKQCSPIDHFRSDLYRVLDDIKQTEYLAYRENISAEKVMQRIKKKRDEAMKEEIEKLGEQLNE